MKKILGALLCAVLAITAGIMLRTEKTNKEANAASAGSNLKVTYLDNNKITAERSLQSGTTFITFDEYTDSDRYGCIYNTVGYFRIEILGTNLDLKSDGWFSLDFAQPKNDSSEILNYDIATDLITDYGSVKNENNEIVPKNYYIVVPYNKVGVYRLNIKTADGVTDYDDSYSLVCRSGPAVFRSYFSRYTNVFYESAAMNNNVTGAFSLGFQKNSTFYEAPDSESFISSNLTIKDKNNNDVGNAFRELFDIAEDYAQKELVLTVKQGAALKNTTYVFLYTVSYTLSSVSGDCVLTKRTDSQTVSFTIKIKSPPKRDLGIKNLLIGMLVLAVLGGAAYGCNQMAKKVQLGQDAKLQKVAEERELHEQLYLEQMREQVALEEAEQADVEKRKQEEKKPKPKARVKKDTKKTKAETTGNAEKSE